MQFPHLLVVAVEEREEAGLSTGRALDAAETEIRSSALKVAQVPEELLDPQGRSFSDGGELSRLEVGESQGRQVAVLLGKVGQSGDDRGKFGQKEVQALPQEDEVGVAAPQQRQVGFDSLGDVARSRTQAAVSNGVAVLGLLNDAGGFRSHSAKGVDMGHHVVCHQLSDDLASSRLRFFSSSAATFIWASSSSRLARICSMAASEMGSPSSYALAAARESNTNLLGDSKVEPELAPGAKACLQG